MFGFEGGPEVGVGGDLHAERPTEHGGDGSDEEGGGGVVVFHAVDTVVDDGAHDYDEDSADLILGDDELTRAFFNDGPDLHRPVFVQQLLPLLGGTADVDLA